MNLVIVESPTKAKKLKSYLGTDFQIEASVGHVRDLPPSQLGVDLDHDFEPTYQVNEDKKKVVKQLTTLACRAETVYLAMDPDREGEAIAWHLQYLLTQAVKKVGPKFFQRATFHEITKPAVLAAIEQPTTLNQALVDAQQARRILDRLVGYQISPVLWRKIRRGLSAGRVQSVALRLIVDREREITAFKPEEYWEVEAALAKLTTAVKLPVYDEAGHLLASDGVFAARVEKVNGHKYEPVKESDVQPVVANLRVADYQIKDVTRVKKQKVSLPPYTTSTLQQSAANRLGYSAKKTMTLAQQLYEEGLITYHRTDAVNLSQQSIDMAREYVAAHFGAEYLPASPRLFKNKSKNAQEAHEAIRVTQVALTADQILAQASRLTDAHQKLYDLIWQRFVASQMAAAVFDQTSVEIEAINPADKTQIYTLKATGSILSFAGWKKVLSHQSDDRLLPDLAPAEKLQLADLLNTQKFTQPPARYNDASLIKELEKRGIGRPSTYASIISVILDRGYILREEKRFLPTAVGETVNDFLVEHFPQIMDYDFTAEVEEDLDKVARGEKEWRQVVKVFWSPLAAKIDQVVEKAARAQVPVEKTGEPCPECGHDHGGELVIRTGRFGRFKSCSRFPECKFTQNIVEKLPDQHCPLCGEGEVVVKKTRYGKDFYGCSLYPKCDWASWQKPAPDLKISAAQWQEMQAARQERLAKRAAAKGSSQPAAQRAKGRVGKNAQKSAITSKTAVDKDQKKSAKKVSIKRPRRKSVKTVASGSTSTKTTSKPKKIIAGQ